MNNKIILFDLYIKLNLLSAELNNNHDCQRK